MNALNAIILTSLMLLGVNPVESVDYNKDVKTILRERCYSCHGVLKQESGLRLDTVGMMKKGGMNGAVIIPKDVGKSTLVEKITATDVSLRMPPEGKPLELDQIKKIKAWILAGATTPVDDLPEKDPKLHWAFQKLVLKNPPLLKNLPPMANPIDSFIIAKLQEKGLQLQPPADKQNLLRRLYLDLIGLPPSPSEIHQFLNDSSVDAYEKVADRLLADTRHGERWGRHWMDIWHYADWYGRRYVPDVWNSAPQIWRWRDWIIQSLNDNKGYDRMIHEMLAADEILPEDQNAAHATGYLVRNWYALNPNDWMRSIVEHTGKAFLGLTFNCAHCHDHKYDPITQEDYFKLRAFFEPISLRQEREPGEPDPGIFQEYDYSTLRKIQRLGSIRVFDKNLEAKTWFYSSGDERNRINEKGSIAPGVPALFSSFLKKIEPVQLPLNSYYPGAREHVKASFISDAENKLQKAESLFSEMKKNQKPAPKELLTALEKAKENQKAAIGKAKEGKSFGAIAGSQSLILEANKGRRVLINRLSTLKILEEKSVFEFKMILLLDSHFNFQLAKDLTKGLTAGYIGFEKGRIVAYKPNSFTEFEVGKYDFTNRQNQFQIKLTFLPKEDYCLLTVHSLSDKKVLVDQTKVALNSWNPVGDTTKGILFDARTSSKVAVDDIRWLSPQGTPLISFEFEAAPFYNGKDIVGVLGWESHSLSTAGSKSFVSSSACNESLQASQAEVEKAKSALRDYSLSLLHAELELKSSQAEMRSIKSRILADQGKRQGTKPEEKIRLAREANQLEKELHLLKAETQLVKTEVLIKDAKEKKPPLPMKDLDALTKQLNTAQGALDKAIAAANATSLPEVYTGLSPLFPEKSSGRRKALALWMTDGNNPLTARVAVNHIWGRHFHAPLVGTVSDFGMSGKSPSHPELLDFLAYNFIHSGWNMKQLHRLIVTSQVYKQASSFPSDSHAITVDLENHLHWHRNTGRMEAEVIRDSILYVGGKLNLTMKGQEIENDQALTTFRRSLYYSVYPEEGGNSKFSNLFDAPDTLDCYRRTRTIIPQQALALTNSEIIHQASILITKELSAQILKEFPSDYQLRFINLAFELILSRSANTKEIQLCKSYLSSDDIKLKESLIRALFSHNDFVTIR